MLKLLKKLARQTDTIVALLLYMRKEYMSKLDELKADIDGFKAAALAEVDALQAAVKDLKDKVGSGITDADIQVVIDQVDAAKAALAADVAADKAEGEPAPQPEPQPEPAPEVPAEPTPEEPQA